MTQNPNPQVGHMIMALNPVIMPIQAKSNFHPMGEKAESRESRNKRHPQEFKLVNLRIWESLDSTPYSPVYLNPFRDSSNFCSSTATLVPGHPWYPNNVGMKKALEETLGLSIKDVKMDTTYAGALGGAVLARQGIVA
jgi:hypothetical protein